MGRFLFLEPFYGGSHKYFADGLSKHSRHKIDLLTLPDRFWKWRMRGSALYFLQSIKNLDQYDGIIATNMMSLSDFKAMASGDIPPLCLYFHENQILYPLKDGVTEDLHYGFTDITSCMSSEHIIFNSLFHKKSFLESLRPFIARFPDKRPYWVIEEIQKKSQVLYPGCRIPEVSEALAAKPDTPLIIWNHRWEHDKNPDDFFKLLYQLNDEGIDFQLAVLGEQYVNSPSIFKEAYQKLKHKIVHFGYLKDSAAYHSWLKKGNIVISTSYQENYGISIVEAIGHGNFPLLPDRLSYREIIPEPFHKFCIYRNRKDLISKVKRLFLKYDKNLMLDLMQHNYKFSWNEQITNYDNFLDGL